MYIFHTTFLGVFRVLNPLGTGCLVSGSHIFIKNANASSLVKKFDFAGPAANSRAFIVKNLTFTIAFRIDGLLVDCTVL